MIVSSSLQVAVFDASRKFPSPGIAPSSFTAVIDEHALHTCVSSKVIAQLGLRPIGHRSAAGVYAYNFQVGIPFPIGESDGTPAIISGSLITFSVVGFQLARSDNFDIVLGRDVALQYMFRLTLDGKLAK